jgi:hypothetical protein
MEGGASSGGVARELSADDSALPSRSGTTASPACTACCSCCSAEAEALKILPLLAPAPDKVTPAAPETVVLMDVITPEPMALVWFDRAARPGETPKPRAPSSE